MIVRTGCHNKWVDCLVPSGFTQCRRFADSPPKGVWPPGDDKGAEAVDSSTQRRGDSGNADEEDSVKEHVFANARGGWNIVVEGAIEHRSPRVPSLYNWLFKRIALHHIRGIAPDAKSEGCFDSLEDDVARGAAQCLRFLASAVRRAGAGSSASLSSLQPPTVDRLLGDRLVEIVEALWASRCSWRWEVDVGDSRIERIFVIIGATRSGASRRGSPDILAAFGQQFVLKRKQTEHFLHQETGLRGRMEVLQDLLLKDMILVVDAAVSASQRSSILRAGDANAGSDPHDLGPMRPVEHFLRFEMALTAEPGYTDDEFPIFRPSPWQLVDWNGLCFGNHPALPPGRAAPW